MQAMPIHKYRPYPPIDLPDRTWPSKNRTTAPGWCSVDLRDGNQALVVPMSVEEKLKMFQLLVDMGFKEIEVGFPSASQIEYDFVRMLIEKRLVPDDVTLQVLTQAREPLIKRTVESLRNARRAIVHLYSSTSELQRRVVFRMDKKEIIELAVSGARLIKEETAKLANTNVIYEYSPESFTGTELDFALEICEAVTDVWQPTLDSKVILNLPATVRSTLSAGRSKRSSTSTSILRPTMNTRWSKGLTRGPLLIFKSGIRTVTSCSARAWTRISRLRRSGRS